MAYNLNLFTHNNPVTFLCTFFFINRGFIDMIAIYSIILNLVFYDAQ